MVTTGKGAWEDKWSPDDLLGLTERIERAKEESESSLLNTLEIVELLELIQGMASSFPRAQQKYFRETVDELVALAVSYLEKFQLDFGFVGGDG